MILSLKNFKLSVSRIQIINNIENKSIKKIGAIACINIFMLRRKETGARKFKGFL